MVCTSDPAQRIKDASVTKEICKRIKACDVVLVVLTNIEADLAWLYYEMGCAHALDKPFIPCVARGQLLQMLPPQAMEYQGVELDQLDTEKEREMLLVALARILGLPPQRIPPSASLLRAVGHRSRWRSRET